MAGCLGAWVAGCLGAWVPGWQEAGWLGVWVAGWLDEVLVLEQARAGQWHPFIAIISQGASFKSSGAQDRRAPGKQQAGGRQKLHAVAARTR